MAPELVQLPTASPRGDRRAGRSVSAPAALVRAIELLGADLIEMRHAPDPRVLARGRHWCSSPHDGAVRRRLGDWSPGRALGACDAAGTSAARGHRPAPRVDRRTAGRSDHGPRPLGGRRPARRRPPERDADVRGPAGGRSSADQPPTVARDGAPVRCRTLRTTSPTRDPASRSADAAGCPTGSDCRRRERRATAVARWSEALPSLRGRPRPMFSAAHASASVMAGSCSGRRTKRTGPAAAAAPRATSRPR